MTTIQSNQIKAEISAKGAELVRLQDSNGHDFLWNGDPTWWNGHAPLLFPIVGKVPNDKITVDGTEYSMPQHGFARTSNFVLARAGASECYFSLHTSSETLARFPFNFKLDVLYVIRGQSLLTQASVSNLCDRPMPISFGFHPALRWPLPEGGAKRDHVLQFDQRESEPIRRLQDGLLKLERYKTPVEGQLLHLNNSLFEGGAIVFDRLKSRGLNYVGPSGQSLRVEFSDMPHLGVWSKPGAGFICIEPWQGYAAPAGFQGELSRKEAMIEVLPGSTARFSMLMAVTNCRDRRGAPSKS
jgi:galactose mutarotase-like enzyme